MVTDHLISSPVSYAVATRDRPLRLRSGIHLSEVNLEVETWGKPNADRSNAILLCHSFSADAHAAGFDVSARSGHRPWRLGRRGWWDDLIGSGKPLDTERYWIVSSGAIGAAVGSTGPASRNPFTGVPWGADFPTLHATDLVAAQLRLADQLGVARWRLVVGGSLGGVQALTWALDHGQRVEDVVAIAASARLSPMGRGHFEYWRQRLAGASSGERLAQLHEALEDSVDFSGGPRLLVPRPDFKRQWPEGRLSPHSYLLLAKLLLDFDIATDWGDGNLAKAAARFSSRVHLLGYQGDRVFSATSQAKLATAIRTAGGWARARVLPSVGGHDSFLTQPETVASSLQDLLGTGGAARVGLPGWRASA